MTLLQRRDIRTLAGAHEEGALSLFMPTHRASDEIEQDPILLKNLIDQAEEELQAQGIGVATIDEILEPIRALVPNRLFWEYQWDGLAIFRTTDETYLYRLPLDFEPLVVAAERFHLKPLLPLVFENERFYLLSLDHEAMKIYQGSRFAMSQLELQDVPQGLADFLEPELREQHLQFHTSTITPGGEGSRPAAYRGTGTDGSRPAVFHGHGAIEIQEEDRLIPYFQQVDAGVQELLDGETASLILAGVEYLLPIYRQVNSYPHLAEEGIPVDPDALDEKELHNRAWEIVEPHLEADREEAENRYLSLKGSGSEQVAEDAQTIVPAAFYKRVDLLFVPLNTQVWGTFERTQEGPGAVEIHDERQPGDEDLLNVAAVHAMFNGAEVYAVEPSQVPGDGPLAAVLRY
jgi:hypothetical protein